MTASRCIRSRYEDPLDLVWLQTARALGLEIVRSAEVHAAWDGCGRLSLARPQDMDADDCLAQLVLHELCHALVEGPEAWRRPDWGLCNRDERHLPREHACHRLQAALADRHGLRRMLAVTTDARDYYDALPADPLADDGDPAVPAARAGWERARHGPWGPAIERALAATAALAAGVLPFAPADSLWATAEPGACRTAAAVSAQRTAHDASR